MRTLSLALISLFVSAAASAGELILPTTAGELQLTDEGQELVATYTHIAEGKQNWFGNVTVRAPATTGAALQRIGTAFQIGWHPGAEAGPGDNTQDVRARVTSATPKAIAESGAGAGANMEALVPGIHYFTLSGAADVQRGEALPDAAAVSVEARHALAWSVEAASFVVVKRGLAMGLNASASMGDTLSVDETEICSVDGTTCTTQAVFGAGTSKPLTANAGFGLQYTGLKKDSRTDKDTTSAAKLYQPGLLVTGDLADLGTASPLFEGTAEFYWAPLVEQGKQGARTGLGVDVNAPLTGGPVDVIPRVFVGATL
jgi:hypothetical protein